MAGLCSGALRAMTYDSCSIERITTTKGVQCLLQPPRASIRFADPKWDCNGKDATFYLMYNAVDKFSTFRF